MRAVNLVRADTGAVVAERDCVPAGSPQVRTVEASLPVESLEPGTYRIRATVLDRGVEQGAVSALVRKPG